jgi:dephospho-CoA kinase
MLTYGLTGGIGSGKSTVAAMFGEYGVPSFDADELGRQILAGDAAIGREVLGKYPDCTQSDGSIDRQKLGQIVFSDPAARSWLEDLLHPAIWSEFLTRQQRLPRPRPSACLIEGAVLLESRSRVWREAPFAGLIVVTAPTAVRIDRLRNRDGTNEEQIKARMAAQLPQHEKVLHANCVIDNGGNLDQTREQVRTAQTVLMREIGGHA